MISMQTTTEPFDFDSIADDDYNSTTLRTVTGRTSDNSQLATILIPSSIVNGLHITKGTSQQEQDEKAAEENETPLQATAVYSPQVAGGISRKDDEGQTDYGGDSPFFIRLPGSPNAIPVYIQYEPVEIKYVPTDGPYVDIGDEELDDNVNKNVDSHIQSLFRDDIGNIENSSETTNETSTPEIINYFHMLSQNLTLNEVGYNPNASQFSEADSSTIATTMENITHFQREVLENDPNSNSLLDGIYGIIDNVASAISNHYSEQPEEEKDTQSENFKPNKPILKRPDPFFVMEAPKLGSEDEHIQDTSHHESDDSTHSNVKVHQNDDGYSLDVSTKFAFDSSPNRGQRPGIIEDVVVGSNPNKDVIYPGDYYLHDSYTGVNLASLVNPVFNYRPRPTPASFHDLLSPQYTPFPITTNPPRQKTSTSIAALHQISVTPSNSLNDSYESTINNTDIVSTTQNITESNTTTEFPTTTTTSLKALPSIEYSPIPAVDFANSYDPSYIPGNLFGIEESIVAPYTNPFIGFSGSYKDQEPSEFHKMPDSKTDKVGSLSASDLQTPPATDEKQTVPNKILLPTEQFLAHRQVWAFPQSREDPGHLDYESYRPAPEVPGRVYSAFYSPLDVPGIDPAVFSYRKVPPPEGTQNEEPLMDKYDTLVDMETQKGHYHLEKEDEEEEAEKEALRAEAYKEWEKNGYFLPPNTGEGSVPTDPSRHVLLGPQFFQYLNSLPYALLHKFLDPTTPVEGERLKRSVPINGEQIFCEWNIRTQPGLYLLMTFHNLSAAYTVDCHGAYIEVERENNGYDARWCGNRVGQAGTRPHVIFAKTEVRITVYDDGSGDKNLPTGFEADIEVIDLFDSRDYNNFMRSNAYPHIRRLLLG